MKLPNSFAYLTFSTICFLIQIDSHLKNISLNQILLNQSKERIFHFLIFLTMLFSILLFLFYFLNDRGNEIEKKPFSVSICKKRSKSIPFLLLLDLLNTLFIFLIKLILISQILKSHSHSPGDEFESSIDFLIGNVMKRIRKDGISIFKKECLSSVSSNVLNLFLLLFRYNYNYCDFFYSINKRMTLILIIKSILSIVLIIFINSVFEMFFKQINLIENSFNIYSYLLIFSYLFSIYFLLITNHSLFYYFLQIYYQKQSQLSNQLIRLSKMSDEYFMSESLISCLIYYILFVTLSVTCQLPLLILTWKYFTSHLIDRLLIYYLIFLLLDLIYSIILFCSYCYSPDFCWKDSHSNEMSLFENSSKLNENHLYGVESGTVNASRTISSCGLTVIDYQNRSERESHPSFQQTPGIATDHLLVMH